MIGKDNNMANNPFGKMPSGMGDIGKMMQQAQKAMAGMQQAEEELGQARVESQSGGGMVRVTMTGKAEILEVKIAKEVVDPEDIETLEDLVTLAVRDATEKANALREERMKGVIPPGLSGGLPSGLF
jgi:DNA-binding YbaB/EbfC family protein